MVKILVANVSFGCRATFADSATRVKFLFQTKIGLFTFEISVFLFFYFRGGPDRGGMALPVPAEVLCLRADYQCVSITGRAQRPRQGALIDLKKVGRINEIVPPF